MGSNLNSGDTTNRSLGRPLGRLTTRLRQANALHEQGDLQGARVIYEEILKVKPRDFDALHLLGVIAAQTKDAQRAADLIAKAIRINPNHPAAYCNRAAALQELERFDAALASYDKAIALKPDYAAAHFNRGNLLKSLRRYEAALDSYDSAIAINTDFAEAHFNRGSVLKEMDRLDGALASFEHAIAIEPDHAEAHVNRGYIFKELGRVDAALASYDRAIASKADFPEALHNRATASLLRGDFEHGWRDYESRNRVQGKARREFAQPLWTGKESISGKRILLHSEQGLGDTLHFCRYAKLVAERGATVILEVQQALCELLSGLQGVSQVVASGSSLPDFDIHCPLLSLPLAFNTTLQTIPSGVPYVHGDPGLTAHWRARLGPKSKPWIGLAWSGNPDHVNDGRRSIPLADVMAFLPPNFQFVALQTQLREYDAAELHANPAIRNFIDEIRDFRDTAALCECMDLIISVDTSVAHLGGALGKRTWVMLPTNPDWRWLLGRDDSPWYPTLKLYRQANRRDWNEVLQRVGADLNRAFPTDIQPLG